MAREGLTIERPIPPEEVCRSIEGVFLPAPEVEQWLRATFLDSESPLYNVEHDHLNSATIGVLWTNVENSRNMKGISGQAEIPFPQGGKWQKERSLFLLRMFFREAPDFLLTFDANYAVQASDIEWCALVDHELYHCAQRLDPFGFPAFTKEGKPRFGIKDHDVEEFVGVVRRYGAGASAGQTQALVEAAKGKPEIALTDIAGMCGNCLAR